ncbi:rSAM-modified peptide [Flavobacterium sp. GA093]|uniref:RSAM-modified peptide n=1 Tax=Flavobacterium hydrocarbonoxydans TaxID=2683249 RepID=A0A6I4NP37_9FLAO|nr:rSAM-modified peptide [Flavobacterium hydrocarbonoxydans]MWB95851.1 rSAM-modified peptide [Flavobacterium hydrocarbonoxydans]
MTRKQLKFEDFNAEKLSKNQQKVVRGGDAEPDPIDPGKATGNGNG